MTIDQHVALAWAIVDGFNRRDVEALEALLAPDAEIVPIRAAIEDTVYRGPDAAARWLSAVDASWEDLVVTIDEVRAGLNCGVTFGRIRARGRESGVAIDVEAAAVAHFHDGLVTRIQIYTDRAKALESAGLAD